MFRSIRQYARRDPQEIAEQREFDRQFNGDDVVELGTENSRYATAAHAAVRAELQIPDSALFLETFIRQCSDGEVRVAGTVRFSGTEGSSSTAGYTVDFSEGDQARLLDLAVGVDPVTKRNAFPPTAWDGMVIPYARPHSNQLGRHRLDWLFWIGVVVAALLFAAIVIVSHI